MAYFILPDGSDGDSSIGNYSYGNLIQLDYFKFHQNYWWLRSPTTADDDGACYVRSSGDVSSIGVNRSYGRKSPDIIGPSYSKNVHRTGIVLGNTNGSVIDSYGKSPNTYYDNNVWIVYSGGYVSHEDNFNVRISYGADIAEHT